MAGKGKPGAKTAEKKKDESKSEESFEPIKVEARLANTTILMLESPEDEIVQKSCEAIFKFCEKSKRLSLFSKTLKNKSFFFKFNYIELGSHQIMYIDGREF